LQEVKSDLQEVKTMFGVLEQAFYPFKKCLVESLSETDRQKLTQIQEMLDLVTSKLTVMAGRKSSRN
jgi:hypothetical protein